MNVAALTTRYKFVAPLLRELNVFWSWWTAELGGLLPKRVRAALLPGVERMYLQLDGDEVIASCVTRESTEELGRYPLEAEALNPLQAQELEELAGRTREVVLCLPADKVLVKTITLPLVAEENLREVLGFEMDRQTPFMLDQVYYDHIITGRDSGKNTLGVELVVTPRQYLDELIPRLAGIGFQPHQASICRGQSVSALAINLLPESARQRRPDDARYLNLALAVIALVLLLGVIALPIVNKLQVINTLEARSDVVTGKAEVTRRLREEVEQLSADARFLVDRKLGTPLALEVIDELTRILPDDTWLNRLDIKRREVQIQGQSASAAALIPLIESSDLLRNPSFRSPVTQIPRSNTERFHLSAEIAR